MFIVINLLGYFPSGGSSISSCDENKERLREIKRLGLLVDKSKYARARANMRDIFSVTP